MAAQEHRKSFLVAPAEESLEQLRVAGSSVWPHHCLRIQVHRQDLGLALDLVAFGSEQRLANEPENTWRQDLRRKPHVAGDP